MSSEAQQPPAQQLQQEDSEFDAHTSYIIKKFKLEDIIPRKSDFDLARANRLPLDGSTPIFAGGKPINNRRPSSSPAVQEALDRGFKLAHFPARALLPEDHFSHVVVGGGVGGADGNQQQQQSSRSPDPALPSSRARSQASAAAASSGAPFPSAAVLQSYNYNNQSPSQQRNNNSNNDDARIPGNISPHVLPQGILMKPLPPARQLMEMHVPLTENPRYDRQLDVWRASVDVGSWALSDPTMITDLARHYRRCFPRTEKDDIHDSFPTSQFAGNYILRRYGGAFPEHCNYSFYRHYSEFGRNAVSSEFHNFPAGRHPLAPI